MTSNPLPTSNDHRNDDRSSHRGRWFAIAGAAALAVALAPAVLLAGGGDSDAESAAAAASERPAPTVVESKVESPSPSATAAPKPVSTSKPATNGGQSPKPASTGGQSAKPATKTTAKRPATCSSYENRRDIPVRMCDKGDVVELVQESLNAWGAPVDADGYFGPRTDSAVRDFQRAHGLNVDGIVGPATWPVLYEYLYAGGDEFDDGSGNTLDEPDGDPVMENTLDEPDGDPVMENTLDEPDGDPVYIIYD